MIGRVRHWHGSCNVPIGFNGITKFTAMTTQDIALFKAIAAKMKYLDQRQRVLSQNVANADTPGYRPSDMKEMDFGGLLDKISGDRSSVRPVQTNPMHMTPGGDVRDPKNRNQKVMYEIAPSGNSVNLEEQMVKEAQTSMDYNLMTTLYQKNAAMLRTAIGRGQ